MRDAPIFQRDRVTVVGVLNATPDSFSDGGRLLAGDGRPDLRAVVVRARALLEAGADVLDVGGESTRPGAAPVAVAEEIARTRPVIEALTKEFPAPVSIDTRRRAVAEAALDAGARIVNDVSGGRHDPELLGAVARGGAALIVGHLRGEPATMQRDVHFDDVVAEVGAELAAALGAAREAGIPDERLVADPGIGFGKRLEHNLALLANAGALRARLGVPLLVGPSRKAFLGELTGEPVEARDPATAVACGIAVFAGADAVRVHDVAGARRAARIALALRGAAA
ncbi:MAG: dihydropteroate synthase [Myxococcota bacterium]